MVRIEGARHFWGIDMPSRGGCTASTVFCTLPCRTTLLLRALFRSRAKKEGAIFSRVSVEALRKPYPTHEREIRPAGRIPTSHGSDMNFSGSNRANRCVERKDLFCWRVLYHNLPRFGAEHEKTPTAQIRVSFRKGQGKPFLNSILRMRCENLTREVRGRLREFPV